MHPFDHMLRLGRRPRAFRTSCTCTSPRSALRPPGAPTGPARRGPVRDTDRDRGKQRRAHHHDRGLHLGSTRPCRPPGHTQSTPEREKPRGASATRLSVQRSLQASEGTLARQPFVPGVRHRARPSARALTTTGGTKRRSGSWRLLGPILRTRLGLEFRLDSHPQHARQTNTEADRVHDPRIRVHSLWTLIRTIGIIAGAICHGSCGDGAAGHCARDRHLDARAGKHLQPARPPARDLQIAGAGLGGGATGQRGQGDEKQGP